MRLLSASVILTPLLLLPSTGAVALGMGRVSTASTLGTPLEFSVSLSAQASDALSTDCISAEVYAGDTRISPDMVRVRIQRMPDGTPSSLQVSTGTRIDEPVASVDVTLNCGTRVSRKYVVFIDPPVVSLAQAGPADAFGSASVAADAPPPSARRDSTVAAPRRARKSVNAGTVRASGNSTGVASAARQRRSELAQSAKAARAAASATAAAETGSRLKLESAPLVANAGPAKAKAGQPATPTSGMAAAQNPTASASAASVAMPGASGALSVAGGASAASGGVLGELAARAEADVLALNAERLRVLEDSLKRLRNDNQTMQKSMAELQARLQEAESTRYANPLVYGLLVALALAIVAVLALLWRQANLRKEAEWRRAAGGDLDGPDHRGATVRSVVRPTGAKAGPGLVESSGIQPVAAAALPAYAGDETAPALGRRDVLDDLPEAGPAATVAHPSPTPAPAATQPLTDFPKSVTSTVSHEATVVPPDPRREVSVEELIDLEQQADFFVVLGQDEAAIDLLMGHVQGTGGVSPLPYLKLLEIHRRRDERELYDRVRERFNRRFNAFAPEWESHSGHDRALEDYPAVVERLQDLWRQPTEAMDALASLLFQRDLTTQTFDLPAYGELLFLYSLARELAEQEPTPSDGVDFLLPLDDEAAPRPAQGLAPGLAVAAAAVSGFSMMGNSADGGLSLAPVGDLDELPSLPKLPGSAGGYEVPAGFTNPDARSNDIPEIDGGLLDLNISDEPEEPKGPLSKY